MDLIKAENLAKELMCKYKLSAWSFQFDRAVRRFGSCNYTKKCISLSKKLTELNDEEIVTETILHEIAHALAGHKAKHGKIWKEIAIKMGIRSRATYKSEVVLPKMKYTATCPSCKKNFQTQRVGKGACRACCLIYNKGRYSRRFRLSYKEN